MNAVIRSASWVFCAAVLASARPAAQNGTNYHVLDNGPDAALIGVGAGGTQTAQDGLGTYVPGEDLRGSILIDPDGNGPLAPQFCYRNVTFEESACLFAPGLSGFIQFHFPGVYFIELDGLNPNVPVVFTRPVCSTPILVSVIPYGLGPSSTVSFVSAAVSALGPVHTVLIPDNGLVAGSGTATIVGAGSGQLPRGTSSLASGCYSVGFQWTPSTLPLLDGIDGLWHWVVNSDDGNQYWQMSLDEMNLWQSNSVLLDNGATQALGFFAVVDYALLPTSREANTSAILAPHGILQDGPYYHQTENMVGGGGPNFGFDVGRGSRAVSFSGAGGVKVPAALGGLGAGAQDPAYGPGGTVPTLGFATWDGKPNGSPFGAGSKRVTWISVDLAQLAGAAPSSGVTKGGGAVRLPVETLGFVEQLTLSLLPIFQHETKNAPHGWPHPHGISSGIFTFYIAGGSTQLSLAALAAKVPCNVGLPVNLQYGTTGLNPSPPPALTFDPSVADISGRKELYLFR
jgi:hypothetical protein